MSISVLDLFKVGIGPSSSHTVGPMRAAAELAQQLQGAGELDAVSRVSVELYGSLGATGKGHRTDKAVLLGLEGELPDSVDVDAIETRLAEIRNTGSLRLAGLTRIGFSEKQDLIFNRRPLPFHPNGMRFVALDATGRPLQAATFFSIGVGFVVREEAGDAVREQTREVPLPFTSGNTMLALCQARQCSVSELMLEHERAWRTDAQTHSKLLGIWDVMQTCVRRSCRTDGTMPGPPAGDKAGCRALPESIEPARGKPARRADRTRLGFVVRAGGQRKERQRRPGRDCTD